MNLEVETKRPVVQVHCADRSSDVIEQERLAVQEPFVVAVHLDASFQQRTDGLKLALEPCRIPATLRSGGIHQIGGGKS